MRPKPVGRSLKARLIRNLQASGAAAALLLSALHSRPAVAATIAHTLRFAAAEDVATLNPELNTQITVSYLSQMTAAYAFRLDRRNRLVPELATVVPTESNGGISKDGKTVTLHLRPNVRWSDGFPFSSADVGFTIGAINNPANAVPSRAGFVHITRLTTPNTNTVVLHLDTRYGAIVPTLFASAGMIAILPRHLLASLPNITTAPFNGLPVGIGPFRYKVWHRGDYIELERNPYYWRGRPALDRIVMKLIPDRNTVLTELVAGEIDMWYPFGGAFLSRIVTLPHIHIIRQPGYAINQLLLNIENPILADRAVRAALRYSVDRAVIRNKVSHGVGILQNGIVPAIDPSAPNDIRFTPFDLTKANDILEQAGWHRGADRIREKNGTRLTLDFVSTTGTPDADSMIELIRTWWSQVGVELRVRRFTSALVFARSDQGGLLETGRFDVMLFGRYLPPPFDMALSFGCHSMPPAGQNYSHYCNPAFDLASSRYDASYADADRHKFLSRALHILDADAVIIVTNAREDMFAVNNDVVNFSPNAATPFDDMMRVDVRTIR